MSIAAVAQCVSYRQTNIKACRERLRCFWSLARLVLPGHMSSISVRKPAGVLVRWCEGVHMFPRQPEKPYICFPPLGFCHIISMATYTRPGFIPHTMWANEPVQISVLNDRYVWSK